MVHGLFREHGVTCCRFSRSSLDLTSRLKPILVRCFRRSSVGPVRFQTIVEQGPPAVSGPHRQIKGVDRVKFGYRCAPKEIHAANTVSDFAFSSALIGSSPRRDTSTASMDHLL